VDRDSILVGDGKVITSGLLESGTDPLDVVPRRSGLGSEETLRRAFQRGPGITPGTYRDRFRTTRPAEFPAGLHG